MMDSHDGATVATMVFLIFSVGFLAGGLVAWKRTTVMWTQETVEKGHAEWVLKNGGPEVEFRWKEPGKCGLPKTENK